MKPRVAEDKEESEKRVDDHERNQKMTEDEERERRLATYYNCDSVSIVTDNSARPTVTCVLHLKSLPCTVIMS